MLFTGLAEELLLHVTPSHGLWRHEELVKIGHAPSGLKSWLAKYSILSTTQTQNSSNPLDSTILRWLRSNLVNSGKLVCWEMVTTSDSPVNKLVMMHISGWECSWQWPVDNSVDGEMVFWGWFESLETVEKIIRQWLDMLSLFLCEIRWKIPWYSRCPYLHITLWSLSFWTSLVFLAFACLLLLIWCDTLWYRVCYVAVGWQSKVRGQVMESWMFDMQVWCDVMFLINIVFDQWCNVSNSATSEPTIPTSRVWVCNGSQKCNLYLYPHVPIPITRMGFKTPVDH